MKKEVRGKDQSTSPATELNRAIAEKWANLSAARKASCGWLTGSVSEEHKKAVDSYGAGKTEGSGK